MRRRLPVLLVVTLAAASLWTAALSHIALGGLGAMGVGGHAYREHAHEMLVPSVLIGALLLLTLLLGAAINAAAAKIDRKAVERLLRRLERAPAMRCTATVAAGGLAALTAMEFFEQHAAFGHVTGIGDALGGNVLVGLATVAGVASLTKIVGLRLVRALVATAVSVVITFIAWVTASASAITHRAALPAVQIRRDPSMTAFLARGLGLRAPPLPA